MSNNHLRVVFDFIVKYTKKYKIRYIFSIIFELISVAGSVVPYYFMGVLIKSFVDGNRSLTYYAQVLVLMALCWIVYAMGHDVATTLSHKTAFQIIADVRKDLTSKLTRLPLGDTIDQASGGLKSLIVEKSSMIEPPLAHLVPEGISSFVLPIVIIIYMFVLDYRMAIAAIILIPISYIFFLQCFKATGKKYDTYLRKNKELNDVAVEYIHGIKVIKVFRQLKGEYERFGRSANTATDCAIDWMKCTAVPLSLFSSLLPAVLLTLLPTGLILMKLGTLDLVTFLMIIILAMGIRSPLAKIGNFGELFSQMGVIINDIVNMLNKDELNRPDKSIDSIRDYNIEFKDVSFTYNGDGEMALSHVNLKISEKQKVALVGPSGSGKSTVARLIASFWDVSSGKITIGGVDVNDIPLHELNNLISYVTQDSFLFKGTVRDNIRMGNSSATDSEVEKAARESGCEEFILKLENGYDTQVGGAGMHLSGGEKQRISLARAMLKNSPIVMLDEATAYIDPENEAILERAISKLLKNKTVIFIAHRLSTIVDCDTLFLLENGKLDSFGTQEELLAKSKLYQNMWNAYMLSCEREVSL